MEAHDSIGPGGGTLQGAPVGPERVRFVLVAPSHTGNIGAAARAIRTMGFGGLSVVAPHDAQFRSSPQAVALAANAGAVLQSAAAHDTLEAALAGVNLAIAMTGYPREFGPPHVELRTAAATAAAWLGASRGAIAFVFGTERSGLLNVDVRRCQLSCAIDADPDSASLNLAQAVQVAAYTLRGELRSLPVLAGFAAAGTADGVTPQAAGSVEQRERFFRTLEQALVAIGFHDPARPRHLLARLRALFSRAAPTGEELDLLIGICAAIIEPKRLRAGRKCGAAPENGPDQGATSSGRRPDSRR